MIEAGIKVRKIKAINVYGCTHLLIILMLKNIKYYHLVGWVCDGVNFFKAFWKEIMEKNKSKTNNLNEISFQYVTCKLQILFLFLLNNKKMEELTLLNWLNDKIQKHEIKKCMV